MGENFLRHLSKFIYGVFYPAFLGSMMYGFMKGLSLTPKTFGLLAIILIYSIDYIHVNGIIRRWDDNEFSTRTRDIDLRIYYVFDTLIPFFFALSYIKLSQYDDPCCSLILMSIAFFIIFLYDKILPDRISDTNRCYYFFLTGAIVSTSLIPSFFYLFADMELLHGFWFMLIYLPVVLYSAAVWFKPSN